MTVDEKRETLKGYREIDRHICQLNSELKRWKSMSDATDNEKRTKDIKQELDRYIIDLFELRGKIEAAIGKLQNHTQREILRIRYIEGQTNWWIISERVGYSRKQALRLHKAALEDIEFV